MRIRLVSPLLLATAVALACDDAGPTALRQRDAAGGATTAPATGAAGADTSAPANFPSRVRVSGRVLRATLNLPIAAGRDSVSTAPFPGARVTLYRNVLVDGRSRSERVGEQVSGADGGFVFDGVPGGYYVLALNATEARPYGDATRLVAGTAAEVTADLYAWTGATGAP